jgi:hypothetical protein
VTPVASSGVTYPVQYVYPQTYTYPTYTYPTYTPTYNYPTYYTPTYTYPTYAYNNAYCTLTASPSYITSGQMTYLTWSSSGATSAWLSDGLGTVPINGSLVVRPNVSTSYTLTVSGYGGTNTCTTYVTVSGGAPYVALSQIPYTGFDFGPVGNALYWFSLLAFAGAGAYLLVYFRGGAFIFANALVSARANVKRVEYVATPTPATPIAPVVEAEVSPLQIENLPVVDYKTVTSDSMIVMHSRGNEVPRIVISRA